MPIHNYGVLKGKAINSLLGSGSSPHYQVHLIDDTTDYRIAVNVKSKLSPSELLFLVNDTFQHPFLQELINLPAGFTSLDSRAGTLSLDYIRANLFDPAEMQPLPHTVPGPDNDLNEKINGFMGRAISDENATVYAFGARWGPEVNKKDKYFGFLPGNGIHDIHMNQGNVGRFVNDDGVWQDGALLIHFPEIQSGDGSVVWSEQWVALFLAFQSQCWHTDDITGHCLENDEENTVIHIVAALVNPLDGDQGKEAVTLINTSPRAIDVSGWSIADAHKRRSVIKDCILAPGSTGVMQLDGQGALLGNKGGIITLLDPEGIKIHGVSYTKQQAGQPGWTIVF